MIAFSPNALRVLEARYLRRNGARKVIETPAELLARVARAVAQAELAYEDSTAAEFFAKCDPGACRL